VARFTTTANLEGFMAPARYEVDLMDLDIDGEAPDDIDGAFYRVSPEPKDQ
jgi:carotenoid cleavage dioxygenase-like enzyme